MHRQLIIQQILSILDITPYRLEKITMINRSTIGRWLQGTTEMDNGCVYQLYHYVASKNPLIKQMLKDEIKEIERGKS